MKKMIFTAFASVICVTCLAADPVVDTGGSNTSGMEKVCYLNPKNQNETVFIESLKQCKRGDILNIGWLSTPEAMRVCDFNKSIIYHPTKGAVVACVYTGNRRAEVEPK